MSRVKELSSDEILEIKNFIETGIGLQKDRIKEISIKFGMSNESIKSAYYNSKSWLYRGYMKHNMPITKEHAKVCMTFIKRNPDNLRHAFRLASKETGLDAIHIEKSYYSKNGVLGRYKKYKSIFSIVGFFNIFKKNMKNNMAKGRTSL